MDPQPVSKSGEIGGEKVLIVGTDPRYDLLLPLLVSCGVKPDVVLPAELRVPLDARYHLAVLSGLETAEAWTAAIRSIRSQPDSRIIAIVPEDSARLVVHLYRAGADVVFNESVDHYHLFLQCSYFLEVWETRGEDGRLGEAVFEPEMRRLVLSDQTAVRLTEAESRILALLVANRDGYVGRNTISETVFNIPYDKFDRRIDVHISNLRKKLRDATPSVHIDTSRLNGFRLVEAPPAAIRA